MSHFLVIGDFGSYDFLSNETLVAGSMAWLQSQVQVEAILTTGDNFYADKSSYPYEGAFGNSDPKWNTLWRDVFHPTKAGTGTDRSNHDWAGNNSRAEIDYAAVEPAWKMDDYFYAHNTTTKDGKKAGDGDSRQVAFVHIDTDLMYYGYDLDNKTNTKYPLMLPNFQAAGWTAANSALETHFTTVESMLAKYSNVDYLFALGHHMIGYTCDVDSANAVANMKRLESLFAKYKVSSYIHGHSHHLASDETPAGMLIA
ncbi:hypothetical protein HDU91_003969, partial [Kappamyces sp. JEL0680]